MNTADMLQYEEREKLAGTPGWNYSKNNPAYAALSAAQQARYDFMRDSIGKINSNWSDLLYRQGFSQTQEVNMSGGTDKTRFFLSAGYFDQQGIDLGSALKRYTTRFNLEHTADKLTVQFNTAIGFSKSNLSEGEALGNSARNPFQMTYRAKTYENPYKPDGTLNYGANTTLALKQVANLLEGIQNSSLTQKQIKANSGLTLAYKLLPSVTLKNTVGIDLTTDLWQRFINPSSYIGSLQSFQSGLDAEAYKVATQIINTSSAIFSKKFNELHEVEAGAYFEVVRGYQKSLGFTLYNLDPRLSETGQGVGTLPTGGATTYPQNATSAKSGFGIRSYFATARYTYNNRYTLNANIRRDGTSRIANDANKEITTWSAGASWNAMQENFMKSQNIFSDLRVRASYGIVPNIGSIATSSYGILGTAAGNWVTVTNYLGPQVPSFSSTSYAGSSISGQRPSSPGNPNLKIEHIQKTNIGADFAVWKNRARFTVDVYKNKTVDLFVNQPLTAESGFGGSSLAINAGVMTNKGIELTANVDVVKQRDFNFTLGFNHAINTNKVEDLGLVNEYFLGTFVIRKGLPYGTHYTYHYIGADPATGKPVYETLDGKTTTDPAQAGQFAKFGTYLPKHVGGFTAQIGYKGFTIDALFSYQFDVVRSNNIRNWITRGTPGYQTSVNGSRELLTNQWEKPGDNAFFQSSAYDRGFTSSDLENAKFLRFRNLNVAYQLPQSVAKRTGIIKGARVYVQAQNIAVWSPWTGLDPEDNNNISLNEYPNPRTIVTGIDINF
jgi:TonB-linked SusC/RagA family outer membrane protein